MAKATDPDDPNEAWRKAKKENEAKEAKKKPLDNKRNQKDYREPEPNA